MLQTDLSQNVLLQGLGQTRIPPSCALVIFGASGDLTKRKLVPALYALAADGLLPSGFTVIGAGRTTMDEAEFRESMRDCVARYGRVPPRDELWKPFAEGVRYVAYDLERADGLEQLAAALDDVDRTRGTEGNRLYYFSVPPSGMLTLAGALTQARLNAPRNGSFVRVIVEKPFGRTLDSARELNRRLHESFREEQIYRIDHYLGKET
ncbi:MAG TPA: glucose-6-phosphate dehydrogenase, partial [Candidatus Dormibacteraeota bacterium]|nr:glucose-6-phosphate dehydrogenase [Candidatus Dormibacteraeota bacterium]